MRKWQTKIELNAKKTKIELNIYALCLTVCGWWPVLICCLLFGWWLILIWCERKNNAAGCPHNRVMKIKCKTHLPKFKAGKI